ncbi:MAG TPA: hypothetical protein PLR71_04425 [Deltaproteobacteria bacterium]|nr:hypothetical protein [Deltaproteobacteria bacterium]
MTILLLPVCAWSLSPITDADLSDVSTPASLIIVAVPSDDTKSDPAIPGSITTNENPSSIEKLSHDLMLEKSPKGIVSAEEADTPATVNAPPAGTRYSIEHPTGTTNSTDGSYRYVITSGNIEMRDTYIQQTNSTINAGSWVDIRPR